MKVSHLHLSINTYQLNSVVHNSMSEVMRSTFEVHIAFCNSNVISNFNCGIVINR